ncbi:IS30 family transposase [Lactiplantibacillus plantarum]|nr:IS30 family transposase [Lactiplantibacillus plantarum]MCT0222831.1 IS30 family transposase [Lactiplantibacillus plantarum]WLT34511.1 IS30 family transposase [Lactiplantibacillus plantarum]
MKEVFVLMQEQLITSRVKGHHLSDIERGSINELHRQGFSNRQIVVRIGVCPQTINNELHRGEIDQIKRVNGRLQYYREYAPYAASARYQRCRTKCHRPHKLTQVADFIAYFIECFKRDHWSPDAVVGRAKRQHLYRPNEMVCTATLYNYIDAQLLEIRNINLLEKTRRRTKHKHLANHKQLIGRSINERPKRVNSRREFGHFEIDTVVGKRNGRESVILTLNERKSRCEFMRLIDGKDADSVNYALKEITNEYSDIIKTITADNGTEFTNLNEILADVYYAHPYRSCDRATNETHNRMICRDIPKGMSLDTLSPDDVRQVEDRLNHLPRRILGYRTPAELFHSELERTRRHLSHQTNII